MTNKSWQLHLRQDVVWFMVNLALSGHGFHIITSLLSITPACPQNALLSKDFVYSLKKIIQAERMCLHHLHYNSILQSKNIMIILGVGKHYLSMSASSNEFALECRVWVDASSASLLFSNRQIKRSTKEVIFLAYSIFLLTRHAKGLNMPPSMCNPPVPHCKFST